MGADNNVPAIRFKGFSGEWVEKILGELSDIVRGASPRPIEDPKWFDTKSNVGWLRIRDVSEQNGRIYYLEQRISKAGEAKTRVLNEPHLLLSIAASVGKPVINYVSTGVHDGFLIFLKPVFDQEFLFQWLKSFEKEWQKYGQPGSQVNLNSDIVKNQNISIPESKEQTKIGNYFQQLDTLIAQHQQKHDKLLNLKKALLEKMFPKQGATMPEIRFKGFSGEWEETALGEITDIFSGGTPQVGNEEYYKGDIPFIRSGEINSNFTELFISDLGLKNSSARLVTVGCILYALYGATSGEVGLSKINGAINQAVLAIIPHSEISSGFVMQWLRKNKAQIIGTYLQGGQGNLSGTIVKSLMMNLAHYDEQTKIGNLFKQLDTLLTQHQAQLKKLNNIKQACLEKMFV